MRQIVWAPGAGTLSGVSEATTRLLAARSESREAVAGFCVAAGGAASVVVDSVTTPGFIFVRAGGGVTGIPEGEFTAGCNAALASARALSTGEAFAASNFRGLWIGAVRDLARAG